MKIGAQLFTLRDSCKTVEDLEKTLERVAAMGYSAVQLSGICAYDPAWMRETLKKYNLVAPITHTDPKKVVNETEQVIADHKVFGCENVGIGGMPVEYRDSAEALAKFAPTFMVAAQKLKDAGLKLCYHNHAFEFRKFNGKTMMQTILDDFDPSLINFTLDTYWVQAGGGDPAQWIEKLAGRVDCIHFKDMIHDGTQSLFAAIYEGNMNFDAIIASAHKAGVKYAFVELDNCYGADPFELLKISFDNVVSRHPELA